MVKIKRLGTGWELVAANDEWKTCFKCNKKVDKKDFFWCEARDKFYCSSCIRNNGGGVVCFKKVHQDFHIIKVVEDI